MYQVIRKGLKKESCMICISIRVQCRQQRPTGHLTLKGVYYKELGAYKVTGSPGGRDSSAL